MSIGDLSRINTNVQSLQAYNNLNRTNAQLGVRQLRLSTGSRINRAEDDSAGYSIAKKLEAKVRGQSQALQNIGDAKSMLTVAEGGLSSVMDILLTMKEKAVQAANDTMGTDERDAIARQLTQLSSEIDDILGSTEFNGSTLINSATDFVIQVGAGSTDEFDILATDLAYTKTVADTVAIADHAGALTVLGAVDADIKTLSEALGKVGDYQKRLSFKQDNLTTSITNYESARSRIADADFAKEQMEIVKLQILQQTGTAALAQSNVAPQAVLSLF